MKKSIFILSFLFLPVKALEIRRPGANEIKEASEVYYYSWHDTYDIIAPYLSSKKTPKKCLEIWQNYSKTGERSVLLIARKNNKIVGVAFAGPKTRSKKFKNHDCEIDKLYILPEYKRQGIGKALLKATLDNLRCLGFKKAILQSLASNKGTNCFYEKMGGTLITQLKVKFNETMNVYEFNLV